MCPDMQACVACVEQWQRVIEGAIGADDDWNDRDGKSYRQGSLTALRRLEPPSVSSQICMNRHSQVNAHRLQGFAAPSSSTKTDMA